MEAILAFSQSNALLISAIILFLAYFFIALEKIPKVTIAMLGASLTLILGLLGQNAKIDGVIDSNYYINYVDWNVIFLLISMMIIVSISTRSGMSFSFAPSSAKFIGMPIERRKYLNAVIPLIAVSSGFS